MASQITSVSIVCSTVCSGDEQRKHQSSASLTFVRGTHRWPVGSPHKGPVTQKINSICWRHQAMVDKIYLIYKPTAAPLHRKELMWHKTLQTYQEVPELGWKRSESRYIFTTSRLGQNSHHFPGDIFKCIFLNENVWLSIEISLKFVPMGPINNIPAFVQIMVWRRTGDKPLSELMMFSLPSHICVTRPQWVLRYARVLFDIIALCVAYINNTEYGSTHIISVTIQHPRYADCMCLFRYGRIQTCMRSIFHKICTPFSWTLLHYNDVVMSAMAPQIACVSIVCSTVGSGADQRNHPSSASLSFVRGIHRWPVNSPHKRPVTRKVFPFDDVTMLVWLYHQFDWSKLIIYT